MSLSIAAVRGMNDILTTEIHQWHTLEAALRTTVERYGYQEIRTPLVEATPLFVRSVGEGTDIVDKEMYSFSFHQEALTLRPEGTAGVVRAYVEHSMYAREPVSRLYYIGPMFRGERPARGRYRQFYQAGCELLGEPGPLADAEMIDMLVQLFQSLGVSNLEVLVNSLGQATAKARYRAALCAYFEPIRTQLSDDSQRRLSTNPLRILDSKDPKDLDAIAKAPSILDGLEDDDRTHFDGVCRALDRLGTPYRVDTHLVRGLDYYTRTLFEIRGSGGELGAQNAIAGGGRYDRLVEELGGPSTPAIGFAIGLERLLLASSMQPTPKRPIALIAPMGDRAMLEALVLARELRSHDCVVIVEGRGGALRAMLRRANNINASLALILGEDELNRNLVQVKDLRNSSQFEVPRNEIVEKVFALLSASSNVSPKVSLP